MSLPRHLAATVTDWGSTPAERARPLPGDDLVPEPHAVLHRAVDVDAPPDLLFRWLCQLRAAPYSYDWIDNWGRRSPRTLTPGLDELVVGQRFMTIFRLVDFAPGRHLVLRMEGPLFGTVLCTYVVLPREGGARLYVRVLHVRPRGIAGALNRLLPAGDLVMMRRQLLTLKDRAERDAQA